jgi:hypothetical protein
MSDMWNVASAWEDRITIEYTHAVSRATAFNSALPKWFIIKWWSRGGVESRKPTDSIRSMPSRWQSEQTLNKCSQQIVP